MDIDKIKKQLGHRLKELRLSKGLKLEDLERWGFSYRYYSKIERGLANVTLDTLTRLCDIFEVSLPELFALLDTDGLVSKKGETLAVKVAQVLKEKNKKKIKKLEVFLDEVL
jgi:transcriptional regulator with XRE-family HTH domain